MKYYSKDKVIKLIQETLLTGKSPVFPPCDFEKADTGEFQLFVDEWFELFPKGIKSGNFYVKTDKKDCFKKLGKFMTNYPEYNKEVILEATKMYVRSCANQGYKYMKLAPYFIYKDDMSALEGYCQQLLNGYTPKEAVQANSMSEEGNIEAQMI